MTAELRYIAFSPAEVVRAITDYRRRRQQPLPSGSVIGFEIAAAPSVRASLRIGADGGGRAQTVVVPTEQLGAALVLHCITNRIPVPARAHKLLFRGRDGGAVMGYALGLDDRDREAFGHTAPPIFVDPASSPAGGADEDDGIIAIDDTPEPAPAPPPAGAPGSTVASNAEAERRRRAFEYRMRRAERSE
ncbi:MAG: hypothetical protein GVY28_11505 [Alphaproteobacteria bacterium]|jgi:hypothetical protein|nr:hypothetical protein [Alphaproteobacteria bacterium]